MKNPADMRAPLLMRNLGLVVLSSLLAIATLWSTHALLQARIADNEQKAAIQPLLEALPISLRATVHLQPAGTLRDTKKLCLKQDATFYRIMTSDKHIGWLIPVTADEGYGGDISLMVALGNGGEILGINMLAHRETAGLGDRIERRNSNWLDSFNGYSLTKPSRGAWFVRKDGGQFDEMTGATVTSRAVTKAVKQSLEFYATQYMQLEQSTPGVRAQDHE